MSKFKAGDKVRISKREVHDPYLVSDKQLIPVGQKGTVLKYPYGERINHQFDTYVEMEDGHRWQLCSDGLELDKGDEVTSVICDHDTLRATCKKCNASTPKKAKTPVIGVDWSQDPDDLDDVDELRDLVRSCQERIETLEEENDTGEWYDDTNEADDLISEALNSLKEAKAKLQAHL